MTLLAKEDVKLFPFLRSKYHEQVNLHFRRDDIEEYLNQFLFNKNNCHLEVEIGIERVLNRFIGCCLIISKVKNKKLTNRFCEYESSLYIDRLEYIFHKDRNSFRVYLDFIFQEMFKCDSFIDIINDGLFSVAVVQFFKLSKNNKDLNLINMSLKEGRVIFNSKVFFQLLKNMIKNHLVEKIEGMERKQSKYTAPVILPPVIEELVKKCKLTVSIEKKEQQQQKKKIGNNNNEPPCITKIKEKFDKQENISHLERFVLATFLFNNETPMEEIKEIFSKAPNYNEKTTDYQLYQIQKTGYSIPNCSAIEQSGFCFRDNKICGGIKNMIQLLS